MAKIVMCGYMVRHPVAGNLLAFFHYLLGLIKLGHQVVYLEESGWPQSCYDPVSQNHSDDPGPGIQAVQSLLSRFSLQADIGYINRETGKTYGLSWDEIKQTLATADILLNIGGVCWLPEFTLCQRRVLIDMDPFFTQVGKFAAEGLDDYHVLFSYGTNIGHPGCTIPTHGREWNPIVPPVVPEIWPTQSPPADPSQPQSFTTIANWTAYGSIDYEGKTYGQKREEFLHLLKLPKCTDAPLELALSNIEPDERNHLELMGWRIRDSHFSKEFDPYHTYITQSRGEFSAAKQAYVATRSGWFSDRSVCYLAAGRPAILQDTGFSRWLPTGQGLLAFSSLEAAVNCIEKVSSDYDHHCHMAREIVEQFFSYKVVLPRLIAIATETKSPSIPTVHPPGDVHGR